MKGLTKGAATVTASKNEILTGLDKPEEFILAIVEVDGEQTHTMYVKDPFRNAPDFPATSVNYSIKELIQKSQIVLNRD